MKTAQISAVVVGADRVAANGDTANKIGTYQVNILNYNLIGMIQGHFPLNVLVIYIYLVMNRSY